MKKRSLVLLLLCIVFIGLGFISYQGFIFYQLYIENTRLVFLKEEYKNLNDKLNEYKGLKEQYEVVLSDSNDLNSNKVKLDDKVNEINKEIQDLESKINDINKKIKNMS